MIVSAAAANHAAYRIETRLIFSPLLNCVGHVLTEAASNRFCATCRPTTYPQHVIRVCVAGITGWAGSAVAEAVEAAHDLELSGGVARSDEAHFSSVAEALDARPADVLVDYTHAAAVKGNVLAALERAVNVVVGSSGLSAEDYAEIDALAREKGMGVIAAGNFSVTAALLLRFAVEAARHLEHWEVIDYASATKEDAPSGTSRELAERLREVRRPALDVPLEETHSVREARGATVAGTQVHSLRLPSFTVSTEALFAATGERLSIRHDAGESAAPYVAGTLLAIRAVPGRVGLTRGLDQLL
jgi:4-hydroxy-tetrahydrodipicolinate reductase